MATTKKDEARITVVMTDTEIKVGFSDWLKFNPRKLDRVRDVMHKAWRRERARVVHEDRVKKAKGGGQNLTTSENP